MLKSSANTKHGGMKRETALPVYGATTQLPSDSSDVTTVTLHCDIMDESFIHLYEILSKMC